MATIQENLGDTTTAAEDEHDAVDESPIHSTPSPSRFHLWYALTVFSAVSLIALCTETDAQDWNAEEKWILVVTLFSLILSSLASLSHIALGETFLGKPLEGLLLFAELGCWVGGLIVIMNTNNFLAVDANGGILNANLYFFSWASLVTNFVLLAGYIQQVYNVDLASSCNHSSGYWAGIGFASFVVLFSSVQVFAKGVTLHEQAFFCQKGDDEADEAGFCKRLKFAIALGGISLCLAVACSIFSCKLPATVNASASFVALFGWALGVAFVTFGDMSPGHYVGNLYFGSWAAFVLSLFMVSTHIKNYLASSRERGVRAADGHKATIDSGSSSSTGKAEVIASKPESEVEPPTSTERPIHQTAISVGRDSQSGLEELSNDLADRDTQVRNFEIPTSPTQGLHRT